MVDVEQRPLGALEQHALVPFERVQEQRRGVGDVGPQTLGIPAIFRQNFCRIEFRHVGQSGEHLPLDGDDPLDPRADRISIQIAQANGIRPADFVAIAGTDAALGRADGFAVGGPFVHRAVFDEVPGENDVGPVADEEIGVDLDVAREKAVDFLDQCRRIDDDAAGDDALNAGVEDSAGDERKLVLLAPRDDGMARVCAPLIADDEVVAFGQQIDQLALGFVAPLQTDHARTRHGTPRWRGPRRKRVPHCMG